MNKNNLNEDQNVNLNLDFQETIENDNFLKVQNKIKLIFFVISALGIKIESPINIPNNEEELAETIKEIIEKCRKNKELIRRACRLLEEMKQRDEPINSYGIIKYYWEEFNKIYEEKLVNSINVSPENIEDLAIKMLYELLFYSGVTGENRLKQQLTTNF